MSSLTPAFFGFDVSDPNETSVFTVAFRQVPTDLGPVAESLAKSSIVFGYKNHFRWSGHLLMFQATARSRGHVRNWVRVLHSHAPIVDVVFHSFLEGSVEPGTPSPQPRSATWVLGVRPFDDDLPDWAVWKAFEAARLAAAKRIQYAHSRPQLELALGKQKKTLKVRFELTEDAVVPRPQDERFAAFQLPPSRFVFFEDNRQGGPNQLAAGDHPVLEQTDTVALVVEEASPRGSLSPGFAWIRDGVRKQVMLPGGLDCTSVDLHADGSRALVAASGLVFEVDLVTGESAMLPQCGYTEFAGWMADGHFATLGSQITLFDPAQQPVYATKGAGRQAAVVADGRALVIGDTSGKTRVYVLAQGRLTLEGELGTGGHLRFCDHGVRPVVMTHGGAVRILGIEERLAELDAKPSRKKSLPLAPRVLTPIQAVRPPAADRGDPPVEGAIAWCRSPSGAWAAYRLPNDAWLHVLGPAGEIHFVDYEPDLFAITDEGTVIAHGVVGLRWKWDGARNFDGACPGVVAEDTGRPVHVELLPTLDRGVVFRTDGRFQVWARDGEEVEMRWQGRGFSEAFEHEGALVLSGPLGTFRITPLP